jgi:anti-anti-sigma factor
MKVSTQIQSDCVIYLKGHISRVNIAQVKAYLLAALKNNNGDYLWLDMGQVDFIDSAGVGIIATLYSLAKRRGCNLVLCRVTPPVNMVLELTRLDQVLQISSQPFSLPASA